MAATLETLSIQFNANGVPKAVENIKAMGEAVKKLGDGLKTIETGKLSTFADTMAVLKKNAPNDRQAANMERFANAIVALAGAINGADFSSFSAGLSATAQAANSMKKGAVNNIKAVAEIGKEAEKAADKVNKATSKSRQSTTDNKTDDQASSMRTIVASLRTAESMTAKLKSMFKGIVVPTKQFKNLEDQANKVAEKYERLRNKIQQALDEGKYKEGSSKYKEKMAELEGIQNEYDRLIQKQKELALAGTEFKLNPTVQGALKAFGAGFSKVTSLVTSNFFPALRKLNSMLGSVAKKMLGLVTASKSFSKAGTSVKDLAKKLSSEFLRLSKMLKLMVTRMALRKVIEEVGNGFKSLALHSEQFDKSMSSIINASKRMGYSFASMISPLINALAPAIVYIIDLLTRLINVINQVFSALSGASTWNRAIAFTDKWSDSIKEAGKSGSKAAKELKKTVLGFDELNQLQDNKNSGGGGSDIKDMFETVKIDPKWKEVAKWLKDMWGKKDFTELGAKLGEKLKKALDSIPWDKIRQTSNDLGTALASLINGLVRVDGLAGSIGKTVAQGVNTVFEFINGFVHKLDWKAVGRFIGETFNGFFENIDWALIKDTVVTGFKGLATAIQEFVETFHWDNISTFVINGIDTAVSAIRVFFEGIKWGDLGKKIGDQITKTIKGTPWRDVGLAIGDMIQAAIDFASNLINQLDVQDAIDALTELWKGITEQVDFEQAGETLGKALQYVKDLIKGFWDENGDEVKEKFHEFFSGLWNTLDDDLPELLGIAFDIGWSIIKEIMRGLWDNKSAVMAILGLALVWGLKSAATFAVGQIATLAIGKAIGKSVATQITEALAAQIGTNGVVTATQAGTTLGDSVGAGIQTSTKSGGIAAALSGIVSAVSYTIGGLMVFLTSAENSKGAASAVAKMLGFDDETVKKFQSTYSGFGGTFKLVQDSIATIGNAISGNKDELNAYHKSMEESYGAVSGKVDEYTSKVKEGETATSNLIKVYKSENEVLADQQKAHDNVVGSYKTHWDVVNQSKKANEDFNKSTTDLDTSIKNYNEGLRKLREALTTTKDSEIDVAKYSPELEKALEQVRTEMGTTVTEATKLSDTNNKLGLSLDKLGQYHKQHEATFKTHADILSELSKKNTEVSNSLKLNYENANKAKEATDKFKTSITSNESALKTYNTSLDNVRKSLGTTKDAEKSVVDYAPTFNRSLESVRKEMGTTSAEAQKTGKNIVDGIKEPIKTAKFDSETQEFYKSLYNSFGNTFDAHSPARKMYPMGTNIIDGVSEGFKQGFDGFKNVISEFYDRIVKPSFDAASWTFDGVADGLKKTFEGAKSAIKGVWNDIADKLNGEHDIGSSSFKIKLPKFAGGGFPEDGLFMANHSELVGSFANGKTAVANNAQIVEGIERGVYSAVSAAMSNNSSSNGYISNTIVVDGEVIARSITKAQEKSNRRYSPQTV